MIGYYVHHVGHGHLRNALCIASAVEHEITGLSSLPRPREWPGEWIELERDDRAETVRNPEAHGRFHWAPLHDAGLSSRMARLAGWIDAARPTALVVDVSVEVAAFGRLMGIPAVVMALPGNRADPAHRLGYSVADAVIAAWPPGLQDMDRDLHDWADRTHHIGGLSRFADRAPPASPGRGRRRVLVLQGSGGTGVTATDLAGAAAATPDWEWRRIGPGAWCDDPWPALCSADVVVTHAGLGALADVAAAGRAAVVIPENRPHAEQHASVRALAAAGLAVTANRWPAAEQWPELLARAVDHGGRDWQRWHTHGAARRAARVIETVARPHLDARTAACAPP
jgi:UDP-N-acetylglucosamine--N-acetylmuramyl-(pentapeptide) pyrophosphoryl-undecaprenol N-acetylglucosamine transferase